MKRITCLLQSDQREIQGSKPKESRCFSNRVKRSTMEELVPAVRRSVTETTKT
jgi:hypothetical protein